MALVNTGNLQAGTVTNVTVPFASDWTNVNNAVSDNNLYASNTYPGLELETGIIEIKEWSGISGLDDGYELLFFEVRIGRRNPEHPTNTCTDLLVQPYYNGALIGENKASSSDWPTSEAEATYGVSGSNPADDWGITQRIFMDDVKDGTFAIRVRAQGTIKNPGNPTSEIDYIFFRMRYDTDPQFGNPVTKGVTNSLRIGV